MKIVLASNSPRRKEILDNIGVQYEVIPSGIDEIVRGAENPEEVVMALALEKALDVVRNTPEDTIVIAADTVVVIDGIILGKPSDRRDAERMLSLLSGREHRVMTGFSLTSKNGPTIVDFESTDVRFNTLSKEVISNYIDTNEPMDKAGAYAIQGHGALLVSRISGDYFNIVGLPVNTLNRQLEQHYGVKFL